MHELVKDRPLGGEIEMGKEQFCHAQPDLDALQVQGSHKPGFLLQ